MGDRTAAVAVGMVLLLGGCSAGSTPAIGSLRTDPDGRGLVAGYDGGSCDGPARLVANETPTRVVVVSVAVAPVLGAGGACDSAAHLRTAGARLRQPIGTRTVSSGGQQLIPFDGARLLVPTAGLPVGYAEAYESGNVIEPVSTPSGTIVTDNWVTSYARPAPPTPTDCPVSRGIIDITIGPRSAAHLTSDWTAVSRVPIGTTKAQLYRQGPSRAPQGFAFTWTTAQGSVEVVNQEFCRGDRLLTGAELLVVAQSLKPA